jgi:hypothetical protein
LFMTANEDGLAIWISVIDADEIIMRNRTKVLEGVSPIGRLVCTTAVVDARFPEIIGVVRVIRDPQRAIGDDIGACTGAKL